MDTADIKTVVMKFGGTSVQNFEAMQRVAMIVQRETAQRKIVVTSALAGITDKLAAISRMIGGENQLDVKSIVHEIYRRHIDLWAENDAEGQSDRAELDKLLADLESHTEKLMAADSIDDSECDILLSFGERLASICLKEIFKRNGLRAELCDAINILKTDQKHCCAAPDIDRTQEAANTILIPLFTMYDVIVTQGFIGAAPNGKLTTLGRGGSDLSASVIGAALRAERIEIWTDVNGVMSADPRLIPEASTIIELQFEEAAELACFGARVLHPTTLSPAIKFKIPIIVRNARRTEAPGTIIRTNGSKENEKTVKSIAHKTGIVILNVTSTRMLMAYGFLKELFTIFDRFETPVDLVSTSEVSISMTIDDTSHLDEICTAAGKIGKIQVFEKQALIALVGAGIRTMPGVAAKTFSAIGNVNINMISQGASKNNLSFVIDEFYLKEVVLKLHRVFFPTQSKQKISESVCVSA